MTLATFALVLAGVVPARADLVLWYNGDVRSGGDGTVNEETTNRGSLNIYENFTVTDPAGWTIDRVWSNDSMQVTGINQASWSIRSGMSTGNGGTVIAGGISAATQTSTGRVNPSPGFPEYSIQVSGLSVYLPAGTYWLSVSPLVGEDTGGVFKSYVSVTLGANAVGTPPGNDANSFINSSFLGYNFAPAFNKDYSLGVAGVVGAVPEPTSIVLIGVGAAGTLIHHRRRRTTHK
jgi:hypothetical protein